MTLFQELSYNKSFSQLAKESNFTFSLFRGRVDWKRLEILDIDRIVRDQDVELLDIHTNNVTNCNLESEYDVKILDPNFIKLFRLAQLLIDFLLHCKRYLEHCIKTAHESVQTSNKEVDGLRKQLKARKCEVKQLKKKLKEIKQQLLTSPRLQHSNFECSLCGKVFMTEMYLQGHYSRRHLVHPSNSLPLKHSNHLPNSPKDVEQGNKTTEITKTEETHSIKKKYEGEIEELKTMFFAEIQKLKQNECTNKEVKGTVQTKTNDDMKISNEIIEDIKEKPNQFTSVVGGDHQKIKENLSSSHGVIDIPQESVNTAKVEKEEWLRRLEEREGVWRARLSAVDQQYKKQVTELQDRLNTSRLEGQEMKKSLEERLEEVLTKFEQTQTLLVNKTHLPQEDNSQKMGNSAKEARTSQTENKIASKVHLVKNIPVKNKDEPPPFQKRKAFVSQKSKTIQDDGSFESFATKESSSNLSKLLEPDENDSDSENIPPQNTSKKRSENIPEQKKLPSFVEVLRNSSNISGVNSISSNSKESITTQLLEEGTVKSNTTKMYAQESIVAEEDESSVSETCTESESESSGEKLIDTNVEVTDFKQMPESSDDHLLLVETQLAEQSLKSMESLLAANPDILCQLREDLTQLCARRLQTLGVDPSWRGLPPATFQNKMAVLTHQRNITAKNHKVYFTLRDKLSEDADAAVHCRPTQSTADSVLARLRNKATQIINAVKFSHQINLGTLRKKVNKPNSFQLKNQPLASSSPQLSPLPPPSASLSENRKIPFVIPKIQSTPPNDSSSLSMSTSDDDDDTEKVVAANVTYTKSRAIPEGSYKSALRNALSTGNLAKKKVLFVDEAIKDDKRSQSENTVATLDGSIYQSDKASSVASLVHEIQFQLSQRSGKLPLSIDVMNPQDISSSTGNLLDLPLSQILPLTKSGRELLESQEKFNSNIAASSTQSSMKALSPLKASPKNDSQNNTLQKVPNPNLLAPPGKKSEFLESPRELKKTSSKTLLEPLNVSPVHSLTSIGSSLLDVSVSPRGTQGSLEWDLQDLEDNLRD